MAESGGHRRFEFHGLVRHGMIETQQPGMQTQPVQRVVTITIFLVATHGMAHVSRVHANLILTACLQFELNQRVLRRAVQHVEMGHSILAAIVYGRRVSDVGLVVLQPTGHRTVVGLHLTAT